MHEQALAYEHQLDTLVDGGIDRLLNESGSDLQSCKAVLAAVEHYLSAPRCSNMPSLLESLLPTMKPACQNEFWMHTLC